MLIVANEPFGAEVAIITGLPRSGKDNCFFSRSGEFLILPSKLVKSREILFLGSHQVWESFLVGKDNAVSKDVYKEADFCGFLVGLFAKKFVFCVLENWFVVRENWSGNFYYPDKWQPWITSYPTSVSGIIALLLKKKSIDIARSCWFRFAKITNLMVAISRPWYNGSYIMAAKPIKSPELHYTRIQFLIILYDPRHNFRVFSLVERHHVIRQGGIRWYTQVTFSGWTFQSDY